jgi:hypothetical protein
MGGGNSCVPLLLKSFKQPEVRAIDGQMSLSHDCNGESPCGYLTEEPEGCGDEAGLERGHRGGSSRSRMEALLEVVLQLHMAVAVIAYLKVSLDLSYLSDAQVLKGHQNGQQVS